MKLTYGLQEVQDSDGHVTKVECRFCAVYGREQKDEAQLDRERAKKAESAARAKARNGGDTTPSPPTLVKKRRPRKPSKVPLRWPADNMRICAIEHHWSDQHPRAYGIYEKLSIPNQASFFGKRSKSLYDLVTLVDKGDDLYHILINASIKDMILMFSGCYMSDNIRALIEGMIGPDDSEESPTSD
ncbi:hypothetical protein GGI24_002905 [Coemansia furcata]|nr:hypothetical protein GGI24_002905 [Coemansia furcata]